MNSTVTRLMDLAHEMANAADRNDPSAENVACQALEAELVRLFTPLSDEQMMEIFTRRDGPCDDSFEMYEESPDTLISFSRAVEAAHGITGGAE